MTPTDEASRRVSRVLIAAGLTLLLAFAALVAGSIVETRSIASSLERIRTELRPRAQAAYEMEINLHEVSQEVIRLVAEYDSARLRTLHDERRELREAVDAYLARGGDRAPEAARNARLRTLMHGFDSASVGIIASVSAGRATPRSTVEGYRARSLELGSFLDGMVQPAAVEEWHAEADRVLTVSRRQRRMHVYVALLAALTTAVAGLLALRAHRLVDEARARAELASQQKTEFASITAHELRSPLNAILGSLRLIASGRFGTLSPDMERYVEMASRNSVRVMELIDELLELDKMEAGMLPFARERVSLSEVVRGACASLEASALELDVALRTEVSSRQDVVGDAGRLRQVVVNLLSNALKHSPRGSAVLARVDDVDDRVRVSVADRGPGIAAADSERIFLRFVQTGAATRHSTGLGLAIAREIVQRQQGRIGVESEPGNGATFWFDLPRAAPAGDGTARRLPG